MPGVSATWGKPGKTDLEIVLLDFDQKEMEKQIFHNWIPNSRRKHRSFAQCLPAATRGREEIEDGGLSAVAFGDLKRAFHLLWTICCFCGATPIMARSDHGSINKFPYIWINKSGEKKQWKSMLNIRVKSTNLDLTMIFKIQRFSRPLPVNKHFVKMVQATHESSCLEPNGLPGDERSSTETPKKTRSSKKTTTKINNN